MNLKTTRLGPIVLHTAGLGPSIVFLHGTNSDGRSAFGQILDRFTKHFCVNVPDFAGCGLSVMAPGEMSLDTLIAQAREILERSQPPVVLAGHSLGAVVAAAAATASVYPELVGKLVLVSGWANGANRYHKLVFETWAALERDHPRLATRFGLLLAMGPGLNKLGEERVNGIIEGGSQKMLLERIQLDRTVDIQSYLKKITIPTLVVGASLDYLVPSYQSRRIHDLIRGSEYVEIESSHSVFREQPDKISTLIESFIAKN